MLLAGRGLLERLLGTASFESGSSAVLVGSSACVPLVLGMRRLRFEVAATVGVAPPRSDARLAMVVEAGHRAR